MSEFDESDTFDENDTFVIKRHISIERARKDVCFDTLEVYDSNNRDHISEWVMAVAIQNYKINDVISIKEFQKAIDSATTLQTLNGMVDKGIVEMSWADGQPVYSLTELGRKLGKDVSDSKEGE